MKTKAVKKRRKSIPASQWQWFGNAAHFICGRWCRFHMATKVGKYLISTVGEYVHPYRSQSSEELEAAWLAKNPLGDDIGCGRKFETLVFIAGNPCAKNECGCGLPRLVGNEIDGEGSNTRKDANLSHIRLCKKYAGKQ